MIRYDAFLLWEWTKIHVGMGRLPSIKEFKRLRASYAEPHRSYHTFKHIAECIKFVNANYGQGRDVCLVKLALFYHDVVYDVSRSDNEELSAQQWEGYAKDRRLISQMGGIRINQVAEMIRMTAKHRVDESKPLIYRMMNDADMQIFLRSKDDYLEYARNIWREYSSFGRDKYIQGRLAFLSTVNVKDVFYTHQARRSLEQAKSNLELERTMLETNPDNILV